MTLPILVGESPEERRMGILALLDSLVPGDLTAMFNVGPTSRPGHWLVDDMILLGPDRAAVRHWRATSGVESTLPWDPEGPVLEELGSFKGLTIQEHHIINDYYLQFGLRHQRRLLAYEDGHLTGWLSILRQASFSVAETQRGEGVGPRQCGRQTSDERPSMGGAMSSSPWMDVSSEHPLRGRH